MDWQSITSPAQLADVVTNSYKFNSIKIGSLLVSRGVISRRQLATALLAQQKQPRRLGLILIDWQWVTDSDIKSALAVKFGIPCLRLRDLPVCQEALALVPAEFAQRYQIMPLAVLARRLVVALEGPFDNEGLQLLRGLVHHHVEQVMSPPEDIRVALDQYYNRHVEAEALHETGRQLRLVERDQISARQLEVQAKSRPVVRLLDSLILQGLARRASDINIRPARNALTVYYRVDGIMQTVRELDKSLQLPLVNRVKIIGNMDISERRLPQDGHAGFGKQGHHIDMRLSTIPTTHGESVVIRLLDQRHGMRDLSTLGVDETDETLLRGMINKPSGLVLVADRRGENDNIVCAA